MDMSATTTIGRSPEEVFKYVADATRDVDWRTGIIDSGMRSEGPVRVLEAPSAQQAHPADEALESLD
jgi:hypothetical protein